MFNNKVMIADLTVSVWNARKYDANVTSATTQQFKASDKSGRFTKALIDPDLLKPIMRARTALEDQHKSITAPWHQGSGRLLPAVKFMDYTNGMRPLKTTFEGEVHSFLATYQAQVLAAQATLGNMYDPADYPSVQDLKAKFGVTIDITPFPEVPDAADWRATMIQEEADEAAQAMREAYERKERTVVQDSYRRAKEVMQKMFDALSVPDKVFRDSLVSNVETVADLLPALNLTGDQDLADIAIAMKTLIMPAQTLRDSPTIRHNTAKAAEEVLAKLAAGITV